MQYMLRKEVPMSRTAPKGQITQAMRVISPARRSLPLSITSILQRAQTAETEDLLQKVHELNVTTDYLQKILRNMSQGLIFINFSGFLITCNASAANFLGINPVEALFQHYSESISDGIFG
ncbi:MAG: hypothetical protein KDK40_05350, partial [Chlamydiia bacterium]|nr:hypothetical protein [Chlamydiia bacterium]